jgi:phenylalanyl-tRNA synthetase beta chain
VAKLESLLVKNGFSEVINFPFTPNKEKESINIDNPLDSNRNNLRVSLKNSLIENLLYNERRQKDSIKLFEISDVYTKGIQIKQQKKLGLIICGRQGHNYDDYSKKLDQKYLNNLLNKSHGKDIFEIVEISRNSLNTKKKDKIYYVEIPLEEIPDSFFSKFSTQRKAIDFIDYKPISEYPSSARDFSFVIEDMQVVNEILDMLDNISDEIIKDSFLFDYYKDDKRKIIKLGYRFVFQSHLKTLSDSEINKKVNEILSPILEIDRVSIPGM